MVTISSSDIPSALIVRTQSSATSSSARSSSPPGPPASTVRQWSSVARVSRIAEVSARSISDLARRSRGAAWRKAAMSASSWGVPRASASASWPRERIQGGAGVSSPVSASTIRTPDPARARAMAASDRPIAGCFQTASQAMSSVLSSSARSQRERSVPTRFRVQVVPPST